MSSSQATKEYTPFFPVVEPQVIHRTSNCIVLENQPQLSKTMKESKGWKAPSDKPYQALGEFQNVIQIIEGLKQQIPHSKEMTAETQKTINKVRRSQNPMFRQGRPDRTLRILQKQNDFQNMKKPGSYQLNLSAQFIDLKGISEGDSTSIMKKMKMLEEQFMETTTNFSESLKMQQVNKSHSVKPQAMDSQVNQAYEVSAFSNQKLITPAMKKLMNSKDASQLLKDEIGESQLRLKAAKYGHKLEEIAPSHNHTFYLPDKSLYFEKLSSSKINNHKTENGQSRSINQSFQNAQNNSFQIKQQDSSKTRFITQKDPSVFITEPSITQQPYIRPESSSKIQKYLKERTGINKTRQAFSSTRGFPAKKENESVQNQSFLTQKTQKNYLSLSRDGGARQEQMRIESQSRAYKTFDNHVKNFSPKKPTKLNELSTKYKDGFFQSTSHQTRNNQVSQAYGSHTTNRMNSSIQSGRKNETQTENQIKVVSMIDSKPIQPPYLNLIPYKNFSKKDQEMGRALIKEQTGLNNSAIPDFKNPFNPIQQAQINWGEMLNEDLEGLIKEKLRIHNEEAKEHKRKGSYGGEHKTNDISLTQFTSPGNSVHRVADIQKHHEPLGKIQEMLLSKLISFESLDMQNAEGLKRKLYNFFFNWQKEVNDDQGTKGADLESDYRLGRATSNDDLEEKKKRLQLKLDQELIEFEERGGFAQVLQDIFNPSDQNSMELDSVFQLKILCKTYYEKKEKLNSNLIQTLDALTNERPSVLTMKKRHLNIDAKNGNVYDDLEWMRINAERERIAKYREIAKDSAMFYYRVLKSFTEETTKYDKEKAQEKNQNSQDPQAKIKAIQKESQLKDVLSYITDYMRAVIENGNTFTKTNLFMMMAELNHEYLEFQAGKYLRILFKELKINLIDFDDFISSLQNDELRDVYVEIREFLFHEIY